MPGALKTFDSLTTLVVEAREYQYTLKDDMVVHGAGRVPARDGLKLEKAGIEREKKGIATNQYLQSTSNPSIYVVAMRQPKRSN